MTSQDQRECDNKIGAIMSELHTGSLKLHNVGDLLSAIVDSQDIKQSIDDFVKAEDINIEDLT